ASLLGGTLAMAILYRNFNLALGAVATNATNSWTKLGGPSQINFSTALPVPRSGVREKCPWFRPMSTPFNFLLPNIRGSCAAPLSPLYAGKDIGGEYHA